MSETLEGCPVCERRKFKEYLIGNDFFLTKETFCIQICEHCGLKFVNPRPSKEEISKYYETRNYISHDANQHNLFSFFYRIARAFSIKMKYQIITKHSNGSCLLDIGCGTGEFLNHCKNRGYHCLGVEPDEKARSFAKDRYHLSVSEAFSIDEPMNHSMDVITLWHVLEHVHDLNDTFQNLKRVLKPTGILVIAVPNSTSEDARYYQKFWAAYDLPRHLYHFSSNTLIQLAEKHGFICKEILPQKMDSFYISLLSEKYRTGSYNFCRALRIGYVSNRKGRKPEIGYSSQVFILNYKNS